MPTGTKKPAEYIPLTPRTFHILLALKDGVSHGCRRRFYKLTARGREVMRLKAERLAELVAYVRQEELLAEG